MVGAIEKRELKPTEPFWKTSEPLRLSNPPLPPQETESDPRPRSNQTEARTLIVGAGMSLSGTITESVYIGVSTQYILDTPAGPMAVYVQNDRPGGQVATGERLTLSWSPESTFVVDAQEGADHD